MAVIEKDLGPVSAYAVAVAHGYTGTEAEWEALIANSAINAQSAGASATAAAASAQEAAQQKTQAQAQAAAALAHAQDASRFSQTAGQANSYAQMASSNAAHSATNASNAQTAAEAAQAAAEAAVTGAEAAQTAAEAAVTDAQTAKTAAETAAATAAAAYGTDLLADDYSTSKTYVVGDYVIYSGNLYRCTTAIATAESWTAAHWTQAQVGPDLNDLKSALDKYNAMNVLPPRDDTSGTVGGNVTYSCTNGWYWTFSGNATSNVNRNLLQEVSSIPEWFKPGNVLRIRLNKTGQMDDVRLVIYAYDGVNPTVDDRYMQTFEDVDYVVPELKDKPGLMIRLYIASGCTVDGTVYPQIVQGMPNAEIVESLESLRTDLGDITEIVPILQTNEIKYVAHPETAYPGKTLAEINDNIVCMPARSTYPAPDTAASGPYIIVRYVDGYNLHIQVSNSSGKIFTRIVKRSDSSIYRDWVGLAADSELNDYLLKSVAIGRFANKKIYCDGDSIMVGVITTSPEYPSRTIASPNIPDAIAARLPNAMVDNKAHGGDYIRSMNDASVSICDSILSDNTVSGYDYFVINGGTNDYTNDSGSNPTTLGTIDSSDTSTFYGAYNAIMQYIFDQNPKARVMLITPCFRNYMHSTRGNAYEIQNNQGITLGDFCDAVVNIGKKYAVPVYDSRALGPINAWNYTTLLVPRTESGTDAHIHPSQDGYTLYGDSIASYFVSIN